MKSITIKIVVLLFPLGILCSQSFQNAGSAGMQFLKIGTSARASAMGGAFGSISGDISSLPINPAAIGTIRTLSLTTQHTSWVEQTEINFIGLVVPISDEVNLALQTTYLTSGNIEITTIETPEGTGQFYDVADVAVGMTSSVRLTSQLTFATTIKYLQERIYDVTTDGLSFDPGMWYETGFKSLNIAKLQQTPSIVLDKLLLLERLKKITIQYFEHYFIVSILGIQFLILPTQQKLDPVNNIIPINLIDWKHNDVSTIRNRFAVNTVELVGISLDCFIESSGSIFLHEVTANHGFEFIGFLRRKKLSTHTINTYLRTVKASLQRAASRSYISISPFLKVRSLPTSSRPPVVIEDFEVEEILKNISSDFGKYGVLMALHTGMRRDEVTNMQFSDIDYENNRILVRNSEHHQTKFSKQRYIPLNNGLIELVNEIKRLHSLSNHTSVYLFINPHGKRFAKNYFTKVFDRAKKEAGITKKVSFHSLRKTFASRLKSRGIAMNTIKLLLGHSNIATTENYVGALDSDMKIAMKEISYDFTSVNIQSTPCIQD